MALKHLNIDVPDVAQTKAFFETYFGFRCLDVKGDNVIAILADTDGFILTISNFTKTGTRGYPAGFHIGFVQETPEQVSEMYERLKGDGVAVSPEPKGYGGRGTLSFYVDAPGDFQVEVLCTI